MQDLVVIRVSRKDPADVFALFPTQPADNVGRWCTCYQRIGQHCAADYHGCIATSRPASRGEAAPLLKELRLIGYKPKVIQRATYQQHQQRKAEAMA